MKEKATTRIGLRITPSEYKMLKKLSDLENLSMTNVIRRLVRGQFRLSKELEKK